MLRDYKSVALSGVDNATVRHPCSSAFTELNFKILYLNVFASAVFTDS